MIINEVELYNFRIYKGLNKIDLTVLDQRNIFIVSGRNGFGKTTFLMSLVWCLYGKNMQEVDDLYRKEIKDQGGYSKYIKNSLNRSAAETDDYNFHVAIKFTNINIPEVPCKEIVIKRSFNTKTSINDEVEITIDGHADGFAKDVGPESFIRDFIMPIEIAKFFFFDAEKIVSLADVTTPEQKRALSLAYSEVLGIKKYEDLKVELEELKLKLRQESASALERNQLEQLKADVTKCNNEIADAEIRIRELREKQDEKAKEVRDIQDKLIREGNFITEEELQNYRKQEAELKSKLDQIQNELKSLYDLIPFAIAGHTFLEVGEQIEAEANFNSAVFKEEQIKDTTNKILSDLYDTPKPDTLVITYDVRKYFADTFEKLIRKHFFSDSPQLPNDFLFIHEFSDGERKEFNKVLTELRFSFKESFKRINGDSLQIRNEFNNIKRRIKEAESNQENPIITELRKRKNDLENEILHLNNQADSLLKQIGEWSNERTQKTKKIEDLTRKLIVSNKNKEKDEVLTRNINSLKDFISRFKTKKKESLEEQILTGLETLMHKKGFVSKVNVEIIGDEIDIILKNNKGQEIRKESLSKGEQQMYATALLRGLVEESDIEFPVFIDSPMQKFDEQHAENIVKYFYPNIAEQVIIFPLINKELNESEYNLLKKNIARTYLINNVNEDKSEFIEIEPNEFISTYNRMYNSYAN